MLTIPRGPARLRLAIERRWDGGPSESGARGALELWLAGDFLALRAELRQPGAPRVPAAPPGTRVEGLWEYDVVECFLAGAGGRYLEVELGAAGHFLVLSFRARRIRSDAHSALRTRVEHGRAPGGAWWAALRLPLALVPPGVRALDAFAIAGGELLANRPLPGPFPDFHQPDRWPAARLAP
jgi:hypothetical protein